LILFLAYIKKTYSISYYSVCKVLIRHLYPVLRVLVPCSQGVDRRTMLSTCAQVSGCFRQGHRLPVNPRSFFNLQKATRQTAGPQ